MKGMTGPTGASGGVEPGRDRTLITLGSDQTVSSSKYIGLGNNSEDFEDTALVMPVSGFITKITFSSKGTGNFKSGSSNAVATLWKRSQGGTAIATTLTTTIISSNRCTSATDSIPISECDEISVLINTYSVSSMQPAVSLLFSTT